MAVETSVEPGRWTSAQRPIVGAAVVLGVVARWWALGASGLTFDEAFTAAYSRLPVVDIPSALRANDSHPPLDYLIRHLFVGPHSELVLRAPSAVFSTLALVLVTVWMRRRSWFGVGVVALFALSPFQLLYGREARMYALMTLLGVAVAMLGERWLRGDHRVGVAVAVGVLVAVACLDHAGGLFLAAGVAVLPGLSRYREAWWWRAAPVAGVAVWAVLWAPSFLDQATVSTASWVPLTSPNTAADVISGLATFTEGTRWIVAPLVLAGVVCTWVLDRVLGRLVVALFVVPFGLLAFTGLHFHVLLPRTLAASAWAVPVVLASLVAWLWGQRMVLGVAVAVLVVVMTLRSLPRAVDYDEGTSAAVARGLASVPPGDGLMVHPRWWWPLATWNGAGGGIRGDEPPTVLNGVDGWYWVRPGAEPTGRTWVLGPASYRLDTSRWPSCGPLEPLGDDWELSCVVTGGS
jgi:uncharacterized membrane protein